MVPAINTLTVMVALPRRKNIPAAFWHTRARYAVRSSATGVQNRPAPTSAVSQLTGRCPDSA